MVESHRNQVRRKDDRIEKTYSEPSIFDLAYDGLIHHGEISIPSREERIRNELEADDAFESEYIAHAGVVEYDSEEDPNSISFEAIDAEDMLSIVEDADLDDVYEMARQCGDLLNYMHSKNLAHRDTVLGNLLYREGEIYLIDNEMFEGYAEEHHKWKDITSMITSAKRLDPQRYTSFREGLEEGYGSGVPLSAELSSAATGLILRGREFNVGECVNVVRNTELLSYLDGPDGI